MPQLQRPSSYLRLVVLVAWLLIGQCFEEYMKEYGATLCRYLVYHHQLPRHYHRTCGEPTCAWDDWQNSLAISNVNHKPTKTSGSKAVQQKRVRIVLSYGHNGFGNQLWQHTFAFMVAESLSAKLLLAAIPENLSPDGISPPNTWQGIQTMERLLPRNLMYDSYDKDSFERKLCDNEPFFIADRPKDWRNQTYTGTFKKSLHELLDDKKPRCIKFLGYFQNYPLCRDDVRHMWTTRMFRNFTSKPGPNDISIYLRCLPRHYHWNDRTYYETILNRTSFENVWLFQAPECPTKIGDNPSRDGAIASVLRLLTTRFGAKKWPIPENMTDDAEILLHDLSALAQSKKLILPVSSWAFWAGYLSNATEIHVNAPPHHAYMAGMPQYIYHNDKTQTYFGRSVEINGTQDIIYDVELSVDGRVIRDDVPPKPIITRTVSIPRVESSLPRIDISIPSSSFSNGSFVIKTDVVNNVGYFTVQLSKGLDNKIDLEIRSMDTNKSLIETKTIIGAGDKQKYHHHGNFRVVIP